MTTMKEFKATATDTCVEAINATSKNLVEVVVQKLTAAAVVAGINDTLTFTKTEAERIAFDARCAFNKAKNVEYPRKIGYDHGTNGGFTSFRSRELELTKIIQNIQHYDVAKATCDELVEVGHYIQTGGSELVRAMHAIGNGAKPEAYKTEVIAAKAAKAKTSTATKEKAKTPEGFTEALEALMAEAAKHGAELGEDGKTFEAIAIVDINNMPDAKPEVMDADAIAKMMEMPTYQNAGQSDKVIMMAAFLRR